MKPLASLSMDLDNQWSYMKTHGDDGWEKYPSYFDILIPKTMEILEEMGLAITFFVVGQDAALEKNRAMLRKLTGAGHEVGNHSFHHEPWLHLYSPQQIEQEIARAEEHIFDATGQKPVGFRGPGFSWSHELLLVLAKNGYLYDASDLPTYIGPLARAYYFRKTRLSKAEMQDRKKLFGDFKDGLRPVKPYFWCLDADKKLLEIPVSTMPIFKVPFHLSYLLYLSRFSFDLMLFYLRFALLLCLATKTEPSILLHPLDLIGREQVPELAFFPAMDLYGWQKTVIFKTVIGEISKRFALVPMGDHARSIQQRSMIRSIKMNSVAV